MPRDYFIYEDSLRDPRARVGFEDAVAQVEAGTARIGPLLPDRAYPTGLVIGGHRFLDKAVLEFFLARQNAAGFDADQAQKFTEKMRRLLCWNNIDYSLQMWYEKTVRDQFLHEVTGKEYTSQQRWVLMPDADLSQVNPEWVRFACWIAVGYMKYGASYDSISANAIFTQVTTLGSDLPAQLKKHGSGTLGVDVTSHRDPEVICTANDAFATIKVAVKVESEINYRTVLGWLCRLLEADFPRSYGIEFRSPVKTWLPVNGLPRRGVHQLFANAISYPALWSLIERYARLAMREFEWYTNIPDEAPAMPGTFAVFALVLADDRYVPLGLDYLRLCDGEHQSIQANLVHAYIAVHGFTPNAIALLLACAGNIQHLEPVKTYPALIANRDSLTALLAARTDRVGLESPAIAALTANLDGRQPLDVEWQAGLYAIWGDDATHHPDKIINRVGDDLKPLYQAILRRS